MFLSRSFMTEIGLFVLAIGIFVLLRWLVARRRGPGLDTVSISEILAVITGGVAAFGAWIIIFLFGQLVGERPSLPASASIAIAALVAAGDMRRRLQPKS